MMRIRGIHTLLVWLPLMAAAQDVHFAQYNSAPLWMNPGLAGHINGDQRLSILHRNQWQSMGSPFRTNAFSYDMPLFRGKMAGRYLGVGVNAYQDKAGRSGMGDAMAGLSLAYGLQAGLNSRIAFGIQGSYGQRSAILHELRWDSQYNGVAHDPSLASGESFGSMAKSYMDLSAGAVWSGERGDLEWTVGASAFHLNQPAVDLFTNGNDRLLRRYMVHGEVRIETKRWTVLPRVLLAQQGGVRQINYGALLHRRIGIDSRYTTDKTSSAFYMGVFHRWGDAVIPTLMFEHKRKVIVSASYDLNISPLRSVTRYRGGAEIGLQWIGAFSEKRKVLPKGKRE